MSSYNIGFYEDLTKIIFQLSSNNHQIGTLSLLLLCFRRHFSTVSQYVRLVFFCCCVRVLRPTNS